MEFLTQVHVFVPIVPVHRLPFPSYAYHPHPLLQNQETTHPSPRRDETHDSNSMPERFTWTFTGYDNIFKLNTDGSSKGNPGPSSFGGLIRDGKGRWVCGYMGKMKGRSHTSLEAEVWSIYKGICLIKEMNLSNVMIETDCAAALTLRKTTKGNKNHPLRSVIEAIGTMQMEQRCCMIHTRRDGNHCADQLAKLGGKQSNEYVVLEEPPQLLIPYLARDIEAATEFERNHS